MPQPSGVLRFTNGLSFIALYSWPQRVFIFYKTILMSVTF